MDVLAERVMAIEALPEGDEERRLRLIALKQEFTVGQRAIFAARRVNVTADMSANLRYGQTLPTGIRTKKMAAAEVGIGEESMDAARGLLKRATPELVAALEEGSVTLNAACGNTGHRRTRRLREMPPESLHLVRSIFGKEIKRSPRRPLAWRMQRALDQLTNSLDTLEEFLAEPNALGHAEIDEWRVILITAKARLGKLVRAEKGD